MGGKRELQASKSFMHNKDTQVIRNESLIKKKMFTYI